MTDSYIDKVAHCQNCGEWVERIPPHPGSQGQATWRHVVPADHHAIPNEAHAEDVTKHEARIKPSAGGYEVSCSCGQWSGVAPALWIAERDAARHELEAKS